MNKNDGNRTNLIEDVQKGREGAFEELYNQTFQIAYHTAALLLSNREDIEDALQSSYMHVAESIGDLRNPDSFDNWLKTIVKHECQKCINAHKKSNDIFLGLTKYKEPVRESEISVSQEIIEKRELRDSFEKILAEIPEEFRICMILFYYEEKSVSEISQELGIPEGTVKSRLYSGRKRLEKKIKKFESKGDKLLGIAVIPAFISFITYSAQNISASSEIQDSVFIAVKSAGAGLAATGVAAVSAEAAIGTATAAEAASVAGVTGAASATAATATSTAASAVAGTAAIKITAVAVAAAVATGGAVTVVNVVDVSDIETTAYVSETAITEGSTAEAFILTSAGTTEALSLTTETQAYSSQKVSYTTELSTENRALTTKVTKPHTTLPAEKETTAPVTTKEHTTAPTTTEEETTTQKETTVKSTTATNPKTTRPTTKRPVTTTKKVTTTAAHTTSPEEAYSVSGGVIKEYIGNDSSLSIPSSIDGQSITAIGSNAFAGNDKIKSVAIPSSVTKIGSLAFDGCSSLTSVSLPSSLQSIGVGAFCGCSSLSSISVPDGVQSIGDDAFSDCSSLTSVTIPVSVTSIGENAFGGCNNLTIRCAENSAAHTYAEANSINYVLI